MIISSVGARFIASVQKSVEMVRTVSTFFMPRHVGRELLENSEIKFLKSIFYKF